MEPLKSLISRARTDIAYKNTPGEVEKMIELAETTITAAPNPVGTKFMPYSGLLVSRQPDWVLTAKGYSKYIWDFESSSTENLYGRYLSYGHVELTKLSQNLKSYRPSNAEWDWNHIPGTTAKYLTKTELNSQNNPALHRNFSDEPFLGGVAFSKNVSVFANLLHDNTFDTGFYARKSVFQFDSIYTCLGSGIKNTDQNYYVYTTLFQNQKINTADVVKVNGSTVNATVASLINPVLKDNYGNAYIVKDGTVNLDFTNSFVTGYINHGKVLTVGKYAYQIVTGVSDNDLNTISSAASAPVEILRNDGVAQIVHHSSSKTMAAVVYDASAVLNSGKLNRVNIPSIIVMQERGDTLEIAFTDPDMHRPSAANISSLSSSTISADGQFSTIQIELDGAYELISAENSSSITTNGNGTTTIQCSKMKDGQTFRVLLYMPSTATQKPLTTEKSAFRIFNRGVNTYRIETLEDTLYNYRIFNLAGNLMKEQENLLASVDLSLIPYPEGIYFLQLRSEKEEKCVKLFRQCASF